MLRLPESSPRAGPLGSPAAVGYGRMTEENAKIQLTRQEELTRLIRQRLASSWRGREADSGGVLKVPTPGSYRCGGGGS